MESHSVFPFLSLSTSQNISSQLLEYILSLYPSSFARIVDHEVASKRNAQQLSKERLSLDQWRYESLPKIVATRENDQGAAYLEKEELEKLVEWKMWVIFHLRC